MHPWEGRIVEGTLLLLGVRKSGYSRATEENGLERESFRRWRESDDEEEAGRCALVREWMQNIQQFVSLAVG